jgi:Domain of unknown function (DUF4383)
MPPHHDLLADEAAGRRPERPDTPAQRFAIVAGLFFSGLGVLGLILSGSGFGSVSAEEGQSPFLFWSVSGWLALVWIALGAAGLSSVSRLASARVYALAVAVVCGALAVWGLVAGAAIAGVFASNIADDVTHAVIAVIALTVAVMPRRKQREEVPVEEVPSWPETPGERFEDDAAAERDRAGVR